MRGVCAFTTETYKMKSAWVMWLKIKQKVIPNICIAEVAWTLLSHLPIWHWRTWSLSFKYYKPIQGLDGIPKDDFFTINTNATRRNSFKVFKKRTSLTTRLHSFPFKVVNDWNSLLELLVNSTNVLILNFVGWTLTILPILYCMI